MIPVIGVDPAPKNPTTIYDGDTWHTVEAEKLPLCISEMVNGDSVLICWDSPLTSGQINVAGCFYERPIERFFRQSPAFKAPKGISVLAYARCPHWVITRVSLGLPRFTVWESPAGQLPFELIAEGSAPKKAGHYVVEVHPAVALWLWCRAGHEQGPWTYKKQRAVLDKLWKTLQQRVQAYPPNREPNNHDECDAYIAYLLGCQWLSSESVILLGNSQTGSFLLPDIAGLKEDFNRFTDCA